MGRSKKSTEALLRSLSKIKADGGGSLRVALEVLSQLGVEKSEWGLEIKAQLERVEEWVEHVELFVRVWACLRLHALGYVAAAAGLDTKGGVDPAQFGHCKEHGALLCVMQAGKRIVPMGPSQIRNELNAAAVRAFSQQEKRELTAEEVARISADASDIRRALEYLEKLGICLRTDADGIALSEFRKTPDGREYLTKLSGENKIRVYLYLKPRPSEVLQGRHTCLPSEIILLKQKALFKQFLGFKLEKGVLEKLKPIYRTVVVELGFDIEPEAFLGDADLQETVRAKMERRDTLVAQSTEDLRAAILTLYPSAAPQTSAANGDPGAENLTSVSPRRGAAEQDDPAKKGGTTGIPAPELDRASHTAPPSTPAEEPLVSAPRARPLTTGELEPLAAAMREACPSTDAEVKRQFGASRDEVPDCTVQEAADFVLRVIQKAGKGINNPAYFLRAVSRHPGSFAEWCTETRSFDQTERKPIQTQESLSDKLNQIRRASRG